ncbi:Transglycosylase SLT domain-containing protein [Proteiniborus ethanoligenes]|uniref:Transglycosylase SLT domain-containing protein n=1 Tax=Proteiniborus ethanoligenes TaxID=415015 RepID=A0A1H3RVI3_9FIRM|nr:transglycosylase SLT domain-containing protein [Proteiniborus ethanoligenes]SDZ29696.1 Transglycosylase SLT domain-containing protein [Proteiniborus ethanoligenes]
MQKRILIYIVLTATILFSTTVYGIMQNQEANIIDINSVAEGNIAREFLREEIIESNNLIHFISDLTKLSHEEAEYIVQICKEKEIDIFLVLGLMKVESNFNIRLIGKQGEIGLTQLKVGTAKWIASNIGVEFKAQDLFEPKYNVNISTSFLKGLRERNNGDIHKTLTAYNRGEGGLKKYMVSRSGRRNPAESTYSKRVLEYSTIFRESFKNYNS